MMTIDDIKKLIASDESRTLELKKTTGELKAAMHTACAFLNTEGGWLVFGVTPKTLDIIGQQVTDNTQQEIAQALSLLEPQIDIRVDYIDVPEHSSNQVIAIHFDGWAWGKHPYTYHGCPYYKVESTTKEMPRQMFEERLRAAKPLFYAWERQAAEGVKVTDLNDERIRGAVRLGVERGRMMESALTEPLDKVLGKLQLLKDGVPNNASVMLFGKNIYDYPQLRLRMARFKGNDKIAFLDNMRAEGNFFDLLDAGMSFFFKWLPQSGEIKGFVREEHLEIPAEALREALVNALCHRQYEKYNLTIGIAIYDNRIEIENPGMLPPKLTVESIKLPHISYPYNPIIADVLFRTTFLENWGSGAGRIIDACKTQGVPEPQWSINGDFVVITFPRPNVPQDVPQVVPQGGTKDVPQDVPQGCTQGGTQGGTQDADLDKWIESQLATNPKITTEELAGLSGMTSKTIKRHISKMPHIKYVGSGYSGHWEISDKDKE